MARDVVVSGVQGDEELDPKVAGDGCCVQWQGTGWTCHGATRGTHVYWHVLANHSERSCVLQGVTKRGKAPRAQKRLPPLIPTKKDESAKAVKAGMKRSIDERDDEDFVAALRADSNMKVYNPKDTKIRSKVAATQAGAYALELMSGTYGTRMFSISLIVKDEDIYFFYYGPTGILYSMKAVRILHDFETMASVIILLARARPEELGAIPPAILKSPTSYIRSFPPLNLSGYVFRLKHPVTKKEVKITLKEHVFSQYALTGRRTFVYQAVASPSFSVPGIIVKFSYQVSRRTPEHELLEHSAQSVLAEPVELAAEDSFEDRFRRHAWPALIQCLR